MPVTVLRCCFACRINMVAVERHPSRTGILAKRRQGSEQWNQLRKSDLSGLSGPYEEYTAEEFGSKNRHLFAGLQESHERTPKMAAPAPIFGLHVDSKHCLFGL